MLDTFEWEVLQRQTFIKGLIEKDETTTDLDFWGAKVEATEGSIYISRRIGSSILTLNVSQTTGVCLFQDKNDDCSSDEGVREPKKEKDPIDEIKRCFNFFSRLQSDLEPVTKKLPEHQSLHVSFENLRDGQLITKISIQNPLRETSNQLQSLFEVRGLEDPTLYIPFNSVVTPNFLMGDRKRFTPGIQASQTFTVLGIIQATCPSPEAEVLKYNASGKPVKMEFIDLKNPAYNRDSAAQLFAEGAILFHPSPESRETRILKVEDLETPMIYSIGRHSDGSPNPEDMCLINDRFSTNHEGVKSPETLATNLRLLKKCSDAYGVYHRLAKQVTL
jgi:hypothetical protein